METAATTSTEEYGFTEQLAHWGNSLTLEQVPEQAQINAKHCLLDWLGVTIAGAQDELVGILHDTANMDDPVKHEIDP